MIASLPMYLLPQIEGATAAWWQGLARAFRAVGIQDVPDRLEQVPDRWRQWSSPDLLLSQSCGYPLRHDFADHLQPVATPCYRADGCDGPTYLSVIVVAEDSPAAVIADLSGKRAAINGWDSQSGMSALRAVVAPHHENGRFFGEVIETGSHRDSMAAVQTGKADVAAIDCVSYALALRHAPDKAAGLRVLTQSPAVPALPYVTHIHRDQNTVARLRDGLAAAIADPDLAAVRDALLIDDFAVLTVEDYAPIDRMQDEAIARGYPQIS
ncbi:MAG: PhnD/SsuA/transferrin family substrate-binding protein [Pseudomonadota bacterium]